jgi:hypothetical protein
MFLQLRLGVVVFETFSCNTQSHFIPTALDKNFVCHTPGLTHVTPQLCLRWYRLIFADSDFEPSDVCSNIRCSV